jgi:CHASE3 domain sensor protein
MTNRFVRVILLVLAAGAAGGAAYTILALERQAMADHARAEIGRDHAAAALSAVSELRAAQRGYVAIGQGHDYWTARVTSLLVALEGRLRQLREATRSEAALEGVDTADVAIENFIELDRLAQEYVSLDQPFLASDLIFSDGLDMTGAAAAGIQAAAREEAAAHETGAQQLRQRQAWVTGGGGAALLLVALLLFPIQKARDEVLAEAIQQTQEPNDQAVVETGLQDDAGTATRVTPARSAALSSDGRGQTAPDLAAAARLCTELGRVMETSELAPLLERAAGLLNASGLVVWVTDRSGVELRPVLTHGYAEKIVAQMRSIPTEAQNAAALTFRSAEARVVAGSDLANGAFVVPLITPTGCVGVFAAELRQGAEQHESTKAIATILAAQVATLVGAPPPSDSAAHAQG